MKKVANCFMSLGSVTRARAIFNGVMSMNSCRVVLIALVMLVCGNLSVFAQIKTGDIVTICYETTSYGQSTTYNYLAINDALNDVERVTKPSENCLWVLEIINDKYIFKSVMNPAKYLHISYNLQNDTKNENKPIDHKLTIANNATSFEFTESNSSVNEQSGVISLVQNYRSKNGNGSSWRDQTLTTYISYSTRNNNWTLNETNRTVTLEKWTRVETTGNVVCTPSPLSHTFTGFIEDAASSENATITIKVEREAPKAYYQNINNTTQKIEITSSGSTEVTQPTIDRASAIWVSSNNSTSTATCAVYGEETKKHSLLSVGAPTAKGNNTWEFPISTVGKSPMEMTTDDGKWADYSDMLRFAFHDKVTDATYYANITVARYSFHEEELPNFVVKTEPSSVAFTKGGGNKSLKITLTHQHGKLVRHMHGNISDNTSDYTKEVGVTKEELTI